MIVLEEGDRIVVEAPAKVNLHLEVLGKRADGYHELETLLVSVNLYDRLILRARQAGDSLSCDDPTLDVGSDNLVSRAVELFRRESGRSDGVAIELSKRIPVGAGLAGGSSDAAATLAGLNRLWDARWPERRLAELGAELGSDVPFFFHTPAAIARGRGEKVESIPMGRPLEFVVVFPHEFLSTADVFGNVRAPDRPVAIGPIEMALRSGDIEEVANRLHNRLEEASLRISPAVAELKRRSADWKCLASRMSGSGSSFYALCSSSRQAEELGRVLRSENLGSVFVVTSSY